MNIIGMIPSRLASSRLPNKPLANICGFPMIAHVIKRAQMSKILSDLYVVTDSPEVAKVAKENNCKYLMSERDHKTGTDRIGEAIRRLPEDVDLVVNIQGDEALVCPEHIDISANLLINNTNFEITMLGTKFKNSLSPSDIKISINKFNEIIYFSRADIPHQPDPLNSTYFKAYHVVSFKRSSLIKFCQLDQTPLEIIESIEYMRAIENKMTIGCQIVDSNSISVDTPKDLDEVRNLMLRDNFAKKYI